jgi:hypothetical protein
MPHLQLVPMIETPIKKEQAQQSLRELTDLIRREMTAKGCDPTTLDALDAIGEAACGFVESFCDLNEACDALLTDARLIARGL